MHVAHVVAEPAAHVAQVAAVQAADRWRPWLAEIVSAGAWMRGGTTSAGIPVPSNILARCRRRWATATQAQTPKKRPDEKQGSLTKRALAVAQGVARLTRGARGGGASGTGGAVGCRARCEGIMAGGARSLYVQERWCVAGLRIRCRQPPRNILRAPGRRRATQAQTPERPQMSSRNHSLREHWPLPRA